jgi:uncharacterized DUF497 family protein
MKNMTYTFSPEKNQKLILERNISFEEVIAAILDGSILDIIEHGNPKYRRQRMYVVELKGYIYLVPFVTDDQGNIFLKTIIPSRKAKKKYSRGEK